MIKKFSFLIFLVLISCADENSIKEPNHLLNIEVKGNWRVVPSRLEEKLLLNYPKKSYLIYGSNQREEIKVEVDKNGVQIYTGGISMGYFLFSEKDEKIWTGMWDERVVSLKLFN